MMPRNFTRMGRLTTRAPASSSSSGGTLLEVAAGMVAKGGRPWAGMRFTVAALRYCSRTTRMVPSDGSAGSGSTMPAFSPDSRYSMTAWLILSPGTSTGMPGG